MTQSTNPIDSMGKSFRSLAGFRIAAIALLAGGSLMAQTPTLASAQAIHACYNKKTGALRLLEGGRCKRHEGALTWGLTGPAGDKGPAGPAGPRGPEGPLGPNGVTGATGQAGPSVAGPVGAAGASGATGVTGSIGATGPTGSVGATGSAGEVGASGPTGPGSGGGGGGAGPTGPSGENGVTGAPGTSLPATLPSGSSESGVWFASNPMEVPRLPQYEVQGIITFPLPLTKVSLPEANAHYVNKAKTHTLETVAGSSEKGCVKSTETPKAGLLEHPVAESGNLCVYAGVEVLEDMKEEAILKTNHSPGVSHTGAVVVYQMVEGGIPAKVTAQGSWAVKE